MARGQKDEAAPVAAAPASEPEADAQGLWTTRQAAEWLGIQKSSFDAAIKRTDWLKDATVRDTWPGLQIPRVRIHPDLVRRFARERTASGKGASRAGHKRVTTTLMQAEIEEAGHVLSAHFGREVVFERLYRNKKNSDGDGDADAGSSDNGVTDDGVVDEQVFAGEPFTAETTRL